ncbi:auxin efflux carrier [Jimgerdemannia flammicorona]|uniref:Auxin efflux carrier n=1 Tax=Jimgerdemannia flammicorona TaxID=994334 RepID=A0A433Q4Y2_9FUNG|nr:auxin efflux carrier [Jimgerdemannia flammicorona]
MPNIGRLIWIAVKPMLKIILTAGGGFVLARKGIVTSEIARALSKTVITFLLPSLLFSNTLVGVNHDEVPQLGILVAAALLYHLLGFIAGLAVLWMVRVPKGMRGQGDIILSVILSIADTPPFGPGDKARGIAYTSVFVAVASMVIYSCGGYKLIESDFTNSRAAKEEPEASIGLQRSIPIDDETAEIASPSSPGCLYQGSMAVPVTRSEVADDGVCVSPVPILPIPRLATQTIPDAPITLPITPPSVTLSLPPSAARKVSVLATLLSRLRWFVEPLLCPPSVGVLLGLVIGLVPPAKALFVAEGGKAMLGLDGRPVLGFVLLLLGAAVFSFRLRPVPNPISVPFPSYLPLLLAFTKLLVIPFATILLLHLIVVRPGGPLDPARKMLRFVLAFQSCTPTGTSVVFLVQCYNPSGEAGEIARWLLVQYVVGVVTMTVVIGWMVWTLGE